MYSRCTIIDKPSRVDWIYDTEFDWVLKWIQIEHEWKERMNELSNERNETKWIETKRNESKLTLNENQTIETKLNESRWNESRRNEMKWIEMKRDEMNRDETRRNELKRNEKRNETNIKKSQFQNENVLSTTTTPFIRLFRFRRTAHNCCSLGLST